MALARACALTAVGTFLAAWLGRKEASVRQQVREFCDQADAKRGAQRQALVVEDGCVPLRGWVLSDWQGTHLALALDATTLGTRCTVWAIRVGSRGCAIPVAWTILPVKQPAAWRGHWWRMLRQLRPAIPPGYTVIVLADRGLYARCSTKTLCRWGPFFQNLGPGS